MPDSCKNRLKLAVVFLLQLLDFTCQILLCHHQFTQFDEPTKVTNCDLEDKTKNLASDQIDFVFDAL